MLGLPRIGVLVTLVATAASCPPSLQPREPDGQMDEIWSLAEEQTGCSRKQLERWHEPRTEAAFVRGCGYRLDLAWRCGEEDVAWGGSECHWRIVNVAGAPPDRFPADDDWVPGNGTWRPPDGGE